MFLWRSNSTTEFIFSFNVFLMICVFQAWIAYELRLNMIVLQFYFNFMYTGTLQLYSSLYLISTNDQFQNTPILMTSRPLINWNRLQRLTNNLIITSFMDLSFGLKLSLMRSEDSAVLAAKPQIRSCRM